MLPISNYDILVVLALSFGIQFGGLIFLAVTGWRHTKELAAMVAEAQRLTKAVAGLVIQEEDKTRALLRQP